MNIKKKILLFLILGIIINVNAQKHNLKILFVGHDPQVEQPEGLAMKYGYYYSKTGWDEDLRDRFPMFKKFLSQHFSEVEMLDVSKYEQSLSDAYDVTIFDFPPKPAIADTINSGYAVRNQYLTDDFDKPAILIAQTASDIGKTLGLKTDWLCRCLYSYAFNTKHEHPIFNTPYKVDFKGVNILTPSGIHGHIRDSRVGDSLKAYLFQDPIAKKKRAGLVSRHGGFTDSPDAEWMTGGESTKGYDAIAISRHGNFFHWGFSGHPEEMTEAARKTFLNSILYIKKFEGRKPIVKKMNEMLAIREGGIDLIKMLLSQKWYESFVGRSKETLSNWETAMKTIKEKESKGVALTDIEKRYKNFPKPTVKSAGDYIKGYVSAEAYKACGDDFEKYHQYFDNNRGYLRFNPKKQMSFVVDEDLKKVQLASDDPNFLSTCIKGFQKNDENSETYRKLLVRYTDYNYDTAKEWSNWYQKFKDYFFFTEAGYYKWKIDTWNNNIEIPTPVISIETEKPSSESPVKIGAVGKVNGNKVDVFIKINMAPTWHIYSDKSMDKTYLPTKVSIVGKDNLQWLVNDPYAYQGDSKTLVWSNEVVFNTSVIAQPSEELQVEVFYQACDDSMCLRPKTEVLTVKMQ